MELLGIYAFQGGKDRWSLSIKFPNIYQIIGNNFFLDEYVKAGMLLILGILMLVMCYMAYQKVRITKEFVILLVVFFGMLTTYFIPHMHERYLYLTDAFLLIYTLIRQKIPAVCDSLLPDCGGIWAVSDQAGTAGVLWGTCIYPAGTAGADQSGCLPVSA